jgi:hypothetical protein
MNAMVRFALAPDERTLYFTCHRLDADIFVLQAQEGQR